MEAEPENLEPWSKPVLSKAAVAPATAYGDVSVFDGTTDS